MLHVVLQTISLFKFKQIFDIYTRSWPIADFALNHVRFRVLTLNPVWFRAAMHPILNYVEFRTNHEPNVVHGVVHGELRIGKSQIRI